MIIRMLVPFEIEVETNGLADTDDLIEELRICSYPAIDLRACEEAQFLGVPDFIDADPNEIEIEFEG